MGELVIDKTKCKGCELCVAACPKNLLKIVEDLESKNGMVIELQNQESCIGCAICAKSCPDYAIVKVYR